MAGISRYVLVDENDREDDYEYGSFDDAKAEAARRGCAVIERTYVHDDQELVWTPDGGDRWPPR